MNINKITIGFVIQEYDIGLNKFVSQTFIAGDSSTWETKQGKLISDYPASYLPFEMKQPGKMKE
jgi:hypothetical protein